MEKAFNSINQHINNSDIPVEKKNKTAVCSWIQTELRISGHFVEGLLPPPACPLCLVLQTSHFGTQQHVEQLRKGTGMGSGPSRQCRCSKDVSAAVQQGLPKTFGTERNHPALAERPWGTQGRGSGCRRDGREGGGGGFGSPSLLRVGSQPVT